MKDERIEKVDVELEGILDYMHSIPSQIILKENGLKKAAYNLSEANDLENMYNYFNLLSCAYGKESNNLI